MTPLNNRRYINNFIYLSIYLVTYTEHRCGLETLGLGVEISHEQQKYFLGLGVGLEKITVYISASEVHFSQKSDLVAKMHMKRLGDCLTKMSIYMDCSPFSDE